MNIWTTSASTILIEFDFLSEHVDPNSVVVIIFILINRELDFVLLSPPQKIITHALIFIRKMLVKVHAC